MSNACSVITGVPETIKVERNATNLVYFNEIVEEVQANYASLEKEFW